MKISHVEFEENLFNGIGADDRLFHFVKYA
jgi:hypothetical protein